MRAPRIIGAALLLLLWLFTGGVAIERVQRFDSMGGSHLTESDQLNLSLEGDVSFLDIPLLFFRYSEQGPHRLEVSYYDHDEQAPCRELRLHSVKLVWDGDRPVELVDPGMPIVLQLVPKTSWNSTDRGVVSHTTHGAAHTFDRPLEIPFEEGKLIRCEIELERVGGRRPARWTLERMLQGSGLDRVRTYWAHTADC